MVYTRQMLKKYYNITVMPTNGLLGSEHADFTKHHNETMVCTRQMLTRYYSITVMPANGLLGSEHADFTKHYISEMKQWCTRGKC